jgi:hypothetical protein
MINWSFIESIGRDRLDILRDPPPFEEIARSIVNGMRIQCSHPDPCHEANDFKRLVACIVIDRSLFDLFFNSCNGYRGWYYRSPSDGLRMNSKLLQLLAPQVVEFQTHDDISNSWAMKSLVASSAKCWLAEPGLEFCPKCEGDWSRPQDDSAEIFNGRWEKTQSSRFGRKAPYLEKLRLMGGFVGQSGMDYLVNRKINRAQEIHDLGWS